MKTNLELARKCGAAIVPAAIQIEPGSAVPVAVFFQSEAQLDDFAERIRADAVAEYAVMTTKGAKAWADAPNATAWVDELRGGGVSAPALPFDTARCPGHAEWYADIPIPLCAECLRRTAPGSPHRQVWMVAPEVAGGACPAKKQCRIA